ncbi:NADP-dependent oxidoreductase [Massilia oculi]|uniref:NADP-dependent oxidoreductase n=1 Tax=Massilia oculi TaxID=945844 RepID=A0A2S2DNN9_9BURK|nr:NADP-dependent oxidoreductase [Massilia oculi]AWL06982.1 NADP-dependent oxidoreductase [Massilia oculi]
MQAAMIHRFAQDADVRLAPIAAPLPGAGEVVVRIEAAGVNPLDVKMISGYMEQVFPAELPYIPGTDFSGVVTATGPRATNVKVGDRVVGRKDPGQGGAFADATLARADALVVIPDEMSAEQAAALPTGFGTARQALFDVARLQAGQRVLIHAGAGGVGSFAVQLARQAGAHVTATASARNLGLLEELGADEAIDYRSTDFTRLPPFDVILDTVGGDTTARSWEVLREGGTLATLIDFAIAPREGRHAAFVFFSDATSALREAVGLFQAGKLDIVIDALHPLGEARAALDQVAAGHVRGKVVLRTAR